MRQYLVLKADKSLVEAYRDLNAIRARTFTILKELDAPASLIETLEGIEVVAAPSQNFRSTIPDDPEPHQALSELIVSYRFPSTSAIDDLRHFLAERIGDLTEPANVLVVEEAKAIIRNFGADPLVQLCGFVPCAPTRVFGNRSRVRDMMGVDALGERKGRGVNVVIIDQGLNRDGIVAHRQQSWGGGLAPATVTDPHSGKQVAIPPPGSASTSSHGMMIARNILDIAPHATVYDVPLIPLRIARPNVFASVAHAAFKAVLEKIALLKSRKGPNSAWILVNAWAIFDRAGEYPLGDYTLNIHQDLVKPSPGKFIWELGHPFNRIMNLAAQAGIDILFGAGNCGQFTTETRCGRHDRGEGHSMWGANAHDAVLTVGAVSANEQWLGYSSQGPAPWGDGARQKPDVCTPSNFCEDNDASRINSGTSASTGLAAGVLAAVREEFGPDQLAPAQLKAAINASARPQGSAWNARIGHGVLDAGALLRQLGTA
jgi:hypothetical protein